MPKKEDKKKVQEKESIKSYIYSAASTGASAIKASFGFTYTGLRVWSVPFRVAVTRSFAPVKDYKLLLPPIKAAGGMTLGVAKRQLDNALAKFESNVVYPMISPIKQEVSKKLSHAAGVVTGTVNYAYDTVANGLYDATNGLANRKNARKALQFSVLGTTKRAVDALMETETGKTVKGDIASGMASLATKAKDSIIARGGESAERFVVNPVKNAAPYVASAVSSVGEVTAVPFNTVGDLSISAGKASGKFVLGKAYDQLPTKDNAVKAVASAVWANTKYCGTFLYDCGKTVYNHKYGIANAVGKGAGFVKPILWNSYVRPFRAVGKKAWENSPDLETVKKFGLEAAQASYGALDTFVQKATDNKYGGKTGVAGGSLLLFGAHKARKWWNAVDFKFDTKAPKEINPVQKINYEAALTALATHADDASKEEYNDQGIKDVVKAKLPDSKAKALKDKLVKRQHEYAKGISERPGGRINPAITDAWKNEVTKELKDAIYSNSYRGWTLNKLRFR